MSALSIQPTYPIFTETDGKPLENGYIWIGAANLDPQVNPINVYWDAALTQLAAQPIRTQGGYPVNSGTPARLYVNIDYSIRVMNKKGSVVYSAPSATERYSDVVVTGINAANVVYDPPFSGGVSTNQEEFNSRTVSTKDFGAVGDGITDDAQALRNALMACIPDAPTYTIGGVDYYVATAELEIEPGRYNVKSTVYIQAGLGPNKRVVGLSIRAPKARPQYAGGGTALNTAAATIIADPTATWAPNQSVVDLQYCNECAIDSLAVKGIYGTTKGIDISNGGGWSTNAVSVYQHKYGIYSNLSGFAMHRDNGLSNCSDIAFYMKDSGDSDLQGNYINTNNQDYATDINKGIGLYVATSNNTNVRGGKIEYNSIGIYLNDTQGINVSGINFDINGQCHIFANYTSVGGTTPNALQLKSINIVGNRFLAGGHLTGTLPKSHIVVYSGQANSHMVISGNSFRRGSGGAFDENTSPPFSQPVGPGLYCIYAEHQGDSSYYNTYAVDGNDFFNGSLLNTIGAVAAAGANVSFVGKNIINLPNFSGGANVDVFSVPSFRATSVATANNVTGDGTDYTVIFGTVDYDIQGNYNPVTGEFTAPVDGVYLFCASVGFKDYASSSWNSALIGIKTGTYIVQEQVMQVTTVGADVTLTGSVQVKMTAGQFARVVANANGGTLNVDIGQITVPMYFSGQLLQS